MAPAAGGAPGVTGAAHGPSMQGRAPAGGVRAA